MENNCSCYNNNGDVMKIIKLKNGKYKLRLSNGEFLTTYDDVIIKNGLLFKKELNADDILKITKENSFYDIYYLVIKYLTKKRRSYNEMLEYINSICDNKKIKKDIIKKIEDLRLINDFDYACAYANDKFYLSNIGPNVIRNDLINKGIAEDIIDRVLGKFSQEDIMIKLKEMIDKKLKQNKNYSLKVFKLKLSNELLKKGYSFELINLALEDVRVDDSDALKKEYNKLCKKLANKDYDSYLFKQKIKEKLYQKGYNLEDINQLINKKDIN